MPAWIVRSPHGRTRARVSSISPREREVIDMNRIKRLCFAVSALAAVLIAGGASWRL
jgi:hypothetical protein